MQIIILNQQKIIPISKRAVKTTVTKALEILKVKADGELTVVYVNNKAIEELNYRFLSKRHSTDVLCFDLSEDDRLVADIVVSAEKAWQNSRIFKTSLRHEMGLYLIHGILHLLGFKDRSRKQQEQMQAKAVRVLRELGIK